MVYYIKFNALLNCVDSASVEHMRNQAEADAGMPFSISKILILT